MGNAPQRGEVQRDRSSVGTRRIEKGSVGAAQSAMTRKFALELLDRIKWDMPNFNNGWNRGADSIERVRRCIVRLSNKPIDHRMMGAALVAASAGRRYSRILSPTNRKQ